MNDYNLWYVLKEKSFNKFVMKNLKVLKKKNWAVIFYVLFVISLCFLLFN